MKAGPRSTKDQYSNLQWRIIVDMGVIDQECMEDSYRMKPRNVFEMISMKEDWAYVSVITRFIVFMAVFTIKKFAQYIYYVFIIMQINIL